MLEHLERHGILELPAKRQQPKASAAAPVWSRASDPQPEIAAPLAVIGRSGYIWHGAGGGAAWNALADRYHYLGHRRPFGGHLRYFLLDRRDRRLGCLLFEASTKQLPCRDRWIGWDAASRDRTRSLLVSNSRFLILPWVRVPHLASKALAMATRRLAADWRHRYRQAPVLWKPLSMRIASGRCPTALPTGNGSARPPAPSASRAKMFMSIRCTPRPGRSSGASNRRRCDRCRRRHRRRPGTTGSWRCAEHHRCRRRHRPSTRPGLAAARRVLNSLLIVLFVFRVGPCRRPAKLSRHAVRTVEQCRALEIPLPQPQPPAASSICEAREKLDPALFKTLHRTSSQRRPGGRNRPGRGAGSSPSTASKITLPRPPGRPPATRGPNAMAHYPQGLVSALCRLQTRIPVDFDLFASGNERNRHP